MSGKLKVIVQTVDDATIEMFVLSPDNSIRTVMNLWKTKTHENRNFKLSNGGHLLDADCLLDNVEGVYTNILSLTAQYEYIVSFQIYKSSEPPQTSSVLMTSTPRQLQNPLQQQFNIDCDHPFRLRTTRAVLSDDLTLREQGIEEGDMIQIDLSHAVTFVDKWKCEYLTYQLFSSDSLADIFPDSQHQRVYAGSTRVDLSGELADIGGFDTYPHNLSLQRECKQEIYMMNAGDVRSIPVWLSDIMKDSSHWRTSSLHNLINDADDGILGSCTYPDLLLHPPPLSVIAHVKGNFRKRVRVPRYGIIADLRHSFEKILKLENFQLSVRGRWLDDSSVLLSDIGITEDTEVNVEVGNMLISITINGETLCWQPKNARVRFAELVEICEGIWFHNGEDIKELWKGSFVCKGCGRRLSAEEEEYQTVPAHCCSVQSLKLEFSPTDFKNSESVTASTQTDDWIEDFKNSESVTASTQTDDWIEDSIGEFSVRLTFPYIGVFWYSVRPDETLRDIINNLRRAGKIVIVSSIRSHQNTLSTCPGWLDKTAVKCKLHISRELYVDADFLHEISVNVRGPIDRTGCDYSIPLEVGSCTVQKLISELKKYPQFKYDESTLILQFSHFYQKSFNRLRRAIDSITDFADEEDGCVLSYDNCTRVSQSIEFLSEETGIKAAYRKPPVIIVSLKNIIWRLGDPPNYDFIVTTKESIHNMNYVAQIEFLRLRNTISGATYLFIELAVGYGNCSTGCYAGDDEAIVADSQTHVPQNLQEWNRCILLLKEGDILPRVQLPLTATVAVFVRGNTQLKVINDKIALITQANVIKSNLWIFTRGGKNREQFSEFEKSVSESLRR